MPKVLAFAPNGTKWGIIKMANKKGTTVTVLVPIDTSDTTDAVLPFVVSSWRGKSLPRSLRVEYINHSRLIRQDYAFKFVCCGVSWEEADESF